MTFEWLGVREAQAQNCSQVQAYRQISGDYRRIVFGCSWLSAQVNQRRPIININGSQTGPIPSRIYVFRSRFWRTGPKVGKKKLKEKKRVQQQQQDEKYIFKIKKKKYYKKGSQQVVWKRSLSLNRICDGHFRRQTGGTLFGLHTRRISLTFFSFFMLFNNFIYIKTFRQKQQKNMTGCSVRLPLFHK